MGVDSTHPQFVAALPDWQQMRDTKAGPRAVKSRRETYLPSTAGMAADGLGTGQAGLARYDAYLARALFPEFVDNTITIYVGLLNAKPPMIELPERLEGMRQNATARGETLDQLLRRIHEEQLTTGRYGLLLEAPDGAPVGEALPFIATYTAERVTNWDDGRRDQGRQRLSLVVLNETEEERTADYAWELTQKYRILALSSVVEGLEDEAERYVVAAIRNRTAVSTTDFQTPQIGGTTLEDIPFVFVNTNDLVADVDRPPLLAMSNLALTVYRGEADYRQALFAQAQDTLVVIGAGEEDERQLGVGASIELPIGGDAKFIGIDSSGLSEQRMSLENDRREAAKMGAHLLDTDGSAGAESGEALKVRVAAKTPTLTGVARTGAGALETILRAAAVWVGADPDEVKVEPNLDFVSRPVVPRELVELMTAKGLGAPISTQDVHDWLRRREFTRRTFEETMDTIEGEGLDAAPADVQP